MQRGRTTFQRHTLVTSNARDSSQPRAASLMEELKEKGGNCLPCGAGDAASVCFQLGGLHPALCTCWSRGTSSLTLQTQQEPPALQESLQVTLSGKQAAAITFSDSSLSLLFTPFASTSTLLLSATLTTHFQISPNRTPTGNAACFTQWNTLHFSVQGQALEDAPWCFQTPTLRRCAWPRLPAGVSSDAVSPHSQPWPKGPVPAGAMAQAATHKALPEPGWEIGHAVCHLSHGPI